MVKKIITAHLTTELGAVLAGTIPTITVLVVSPLPLLLTLLLLSWWWACRSCCGGDCGGGCTAPATAIMVVVVGYLISAAPTIARVVVGPLHPLASSWR